MKKLIIPISFFLFTAAIKPDNVLAQEEFTLTDAEYFTSPDADVFVYSDSYFEGHQGGINIIHHGSRIAANGDLRLETAPGQWEAFSQLDDKTIDRKDNIIKVSLSYPNEQAKKRSFNPVEYPDIQLQYSLRIKAEGNAFRIFVDLKKPLPKKLLGKAGFNLELFPGDLFNKSFSMDENTGMFPRQLNGPFINASKDVYDIVPLAIGKKLVLVPESEEKRIVIESLTGPIELFDGRAMHNNGWFIARTLIPKDATTAAIEWLVTPSVIHGWRYGPVIHINEAGYFTRQNKTALIECDIRDSLPAKVTVVRILPGGETEIVLSDAVICWGIYQHFAYYHFDFTSVIQPGLYFLTYEDKKSEEFQIGNNIFDRHVWQPTLEYFLPVQMCHMRINDRYKVWHGLCHMDDARMAPTDHIHFDGYVQGNSTLTSFNPLDHVPDLNVGGWHDAGDYDLRVESQGGTVYALSLIYEAFHPDYDITTIDQHEHVVEMHQPDGKPDILQQIEHGTISIVNGYRSLGRLYRGIICNDLRQYVILGDGSVMTDNIVYSEEKPVGIPEWFEQKNDDRWVFTENNPKRELQVCAYLAAASRTLTGFNDTLAKQSLEIAETLWKTDMNSEYNEEKILALVELILATGREDYMNQLLSMKNEVASHVPETGWSVARVLNRIEDPIFQRGYMLAVQKYYMDLLTETGTNPFGVPYKPRIWGSAWGTEKFGVEQYYMYSLLKIEDAKKYMLNALNYVLGVHPGENTLSFVSGVGTKSAIVAYGLNRDDGSYIPGGVVSGTAYIKPDFPEFKEWPYLWQQSEYVIGGGASSFMFLVLGAKEIGKEYTHKTGNL